MIAKLGNLLQLFNYQLYIKFRCSKTKNKIQLVGGIWNSEHFTCFLYLIIKRMSICR
jgi:hypothetical protein